MNGNILTQGGDSVEVTVVGEFMCACVVVHTDPAYQVLASMELTSQYRLRITTMEPTACLTHHKQPLPAHRRMSGSQVHTFPTATAKDILSDFFLSVAGGLTARYYSDETLDTLVLTRTDTKVDFSWGYSAPAAGLPAGEPDRVCVNELCVNIALQTISVSRGAEK